MLLARCSVPQLSPAAMPRRSDATGASGGLPRPRLRFLGLVRRAWRLTRSWRSSLWAAWASSRSRGCQLRCAANPRLPQLHAGRVLLCSCGCTAARVVGTWMQAGLVLKDAGLGCTGRARGNLRLHSARLLQLTSLVVNDNALTGASLTGLATLSSLRRLDLAGELCQGAAMWLQCCRRRVAVLATMHGSVARAIDDRCFLETQRSQQDILERACFGGLLMRRACVAKP